MSTGASPTGSRRFWVVVVCFAIVNATVWGMYDRVQRWRQHGELRVEAFEPGDLSEPGSRAILRWHFNMDVVPSSVYGRDPGTITPQVAGHWIWDDPRTLCFIPEGTWPQATRLAFTLSDVFLRSRGGGTLSGPYVSTVDSAPLAVVGASQVACKDGDRFVIEIEFSEPVNPADVIEHLHVTAANGAPIHCNAYGSATDRTVRVQTDSIPQTDNEKTTQLSVSIAAGLSGSAGPLGLVSDFEGTLQLERSLAALELTAVSPLRDRPYLYLRLNGDADVEKLKPVLSVSPAMAFDLEGGDGAARLIGDFQPGTRYTVTIAPPPSGGDSSQYPKPGHLSAFVPDRDSGIWFDNTQGYLSSAGNRTLLAHAVNMNSVKLAITRMYDNNLVNWRNTGDHGNGEDTESYSKPIVEKTIKIPAAKNAVKDIRLSLDDLLPAGIDDGVFRVTLSPVTEDSSDDADSNDGTASAVVTLSDIGLTAKHTRDGVVVWATSLRTAQPIADVRARVYSSKSQELGEAITGTDGIARIDGVHLAKDELVAVVLADRVLPMGPRNTASKLAGYTGLTWLDLSNTGWDFGDADTGGRAYLRKGYEAFVYTDRGVYRPGETVHLRAIVRGVDQKTPERGLPIEWLIRRPDLHDWRSQPATLDADGAVAFDAAIPAEMPTGQWTALIGLPGSSGSEDKFFGTVTFQVEEFIPNRLKASLKFKGLANADTEDRFNLQNGDLTAEIQSDYLFGRPAAGLAVELATKLQPVDFSPTGWSDWTFGDSAEVNKSAEQNARAGKKTRHREEQSLDADGHYEWDIDLSEAVGKNISGKYEGPWRLTASAGVRETGGRAVTATRSVIVDALQTYIGIRREGNSVTSPGQPCPLDVQRIHADGTSDPSDGELHAELFRESWNTSLVFRDGHYHYDSTRILQSVSKASVPISQGKGQWSPIPPASGSYVAELTDESTGAMTSLDFDVTDGSPWNDNVSRDNPEHLLVKILPGPPLTSGATAKVEIASPFAGRLLLAVETDDVVQTHVLDMSSSHVVVPINLSTACWPNAFVSATVVRPIDPNAKWQPHRAYGVTRLRMDPSDRRLNITLSAPPELRPESSLDVRIAVTDPQGNPAANTAVTLAAVDEGICQLTNFQTPDPLKFFAGDHALGVDSFDIYDLLMPETARPDGTKAIGGDKEAPSTRHITPIVARRVKPVALAWSEVHTDAQGFALASFSLPPFEGKLRVMALAFNAQEMGSTDVPVLVRSPVMEQSSWPRFAAPGDKFIASMVVFNNSPAAGNATATIDSDAILSFTGGANHWQVPGFFVPAHGQKEIEIPVNVGLAAGVAHVHMKVSFHGQDFDESLELPIRPAAPMTQFGGYALASTTQPTTVTVPADVLPGTGDLSIRISKWPSLRLPEAFDYLDRYPYGCVEQTTSESFPLLALAQVGRQIDPNRFDPNMVKAKIDSGIMALIGMQTSDGGLSMWPGGKDDWDWGTVYAAHFLTEARKAGYGVPDDFYKHLMRYVRHLMDAGTDDSDSLETQAYAGYVLVLADEPPRDLLDRLSELATAKNTDDSVDDAAIRADARLFLACARMLSGRSDLAEQMLPAEIPAPRVHRQFAGNIGSAIRDRAMLIYALATVRPQDPALPDLVQKLVDAGRLDQWDGTQDTAFCLLAIGQYLQHARAPAPFDSAKLFADSQQLAESDGGNPLSFDLRNPSKNNKYSIRITGKQNAGASVSWLETGVPLNPPADQQHGITIRRRYLSLDGNELPGGSALSGQLVRVELTIDASPGEENLVIEDMLPAGLEAENARLETTAKDYADSDDSKIAPFPSDRVDIRDDRVVFMGDMPNAGEARCEYLARAVTPGVFVIPPVRAEAMYDIATCGISGGGGKFTVSKDHGSMASIRQ